MFQIPSISDVDDDGAEPPISVFSKRQKVSNTSKKTVEGETKKSTPISIQRNDALPTKQINQSERENNIVQSNLSGIDQSKELISPSHLVQSTSSVSSENSFKVDYKQIVDAAPAASQQLRKIISAASDPHNADSLSSKKSKDIFDIEDKEMPMDGPICSNNSKTAPVPPTRNYSGSTIFALNRQKGNPILKFIRNVPVEFVPDIAPDYILSESTCALFLSLRYHHLNPNYIYDRIRKVGSAFKLRVLLLQVDVVDPTQSLCELNKACFHADCTLLLAFSPQEAGRYLETYKVYQFKPVDLLRANIETDPTSRAIDFLTTIKSITKRDAETLLNQFDTIANICRASEAQMKACSGLGDTKANKVYIALHQPFLKKTNKLSAQNETSNNKDNEDESNDVIIPPT